MALRVDPDHLLENLAGKLVKEFLPNLFQSLFQKKRSQKEKGLIS